MSKQNNKELVLMPHNAKAQVNKSQVKVQLNNEDGISSIVLKSPEQTQNVHMFDAVQELLTNQGANITSIDFSGVPLVRTDTSYHQMAEQDVTTTYPMDQRTIGFMQSIGRHCPNLATLKLAFTSIDAKALQGIFQYLNGNAIAYLDISNNSLYGFSLLQLMHNIPNVKCIKADNTYIIQEEISTLTQSNPTLFNVQAYELQHLSENLDIGHVLGKPVSKKAVHKQKLKELVTTPHSSKAQVDNEDGVNAIVLKSPEQTQNVHMFDALQDLLLNQGADISSIDFSGVPLVRTDTSYHQMAQQDVTTTYPMDQRTIGFMQSIGQHCPNLATLKLASTSIDAKALQGILQCLNGNAIAYLDISNNSLYGFSLLQLMHNIPNVKCIKVNSTSISPEEVSNLKKFNPSLFDVNGYEAKIACTQLIFDTLGDFLHTDLVGLVEEYYNDAI